MSGDDGVDTLNLSEWFSARRLHYTPRHFIVINVGLTSESLDWIESWLHGRYSIVPWCEQDIDSILDVQLNLFQSRPIVIESELGYPAFEDHKEAIHFRLKWG